MKQVIVYDTPNGWKMYLSLNNGSMEGLTILNAKSFREALKTFRMAFGLVGKHLEIVHN